MLVDSRGIAGQKETTERVQELLALQSSILDALPIAVMGMEERRIVLANHAVEDVFGWKPEELIG
ncbi:MAG: PAS domain-containing protein, partial [Syntrophobacterales bacterium]|nr:PAS domain-containing protein [Syntrophobacterales bacterium]